MLELACGAFETVCGRHGTVTMLESRITRGRAPRLGASKPLLVVASFEQPVGKLGVALSKDGVVGVEFLWGLWSLFSSQDNQSKILADARPRTVD